MLTPEPSLLWNFFTQLAAVPRESKKEDRAVEWLVNTGRELGCTVETQPLAGPDRPFFANVLLRKAATPGREDRPVTALQAHIDMVCEKNEGCDHDFSRDPIRLRRDGDNVWATGTTLGADNGIGLCAALAALADPDLQHGPLEVLITVDEEAGMTGARLLQPDWLRATYLLNLDSEEEGEATISCAGAIDSTGTRRLSLTPPAAGSVAMVLKVRGLRGGHSGLNIGEGRGNANKVLAGLLSVLLEDAAVELSGLQGGNKRNAIPREATANLCAPPEKADALRAAVEREYVRIRGLFGAVEPDLAITLEPAAAPATVMSRADADAFVRALEALPNAVQAMSAEVPGLVETSTNLSIVTTQEGIAEISLLSRSSVDAAKAALAARISGIFAAHGFACREDNNYPGWQPRPESDIVRLVKRTQLEVFGRELKISAIHAGLECGLLGQGYPDLQMISFGPNMWGVHTPEEHVSIPSVANFWKLLRAVLENV